MDQFLREHVALEKDDRLSALNQFRVSANDFLGHEYFVLPAVLFSTSLTPSDGISRHVSIRIFHRGADDLHEGTSLFGHHLNYFQPYTFLVRDSRCGYTTESLLHV